MPRQSSGTYTQPANTAAVSLQTIGSAAFNSLIADLGAEISNSLDRRGRGAMLAALNLGGFPVNDVAAPVLPTDAARLSDITASAQVPSFIIGAVAGASTSDAIQATFAPTILALVSGLKVLVRAAAANTTPAPTFQADTQAAAPIVKGLNQPLGVGDISGAGHWLELLYDATFGAWILLNPAGGLGQFIGMIAPFAMLTVTGGNWFRCSGQALPRSTWPALFAAIGTSYGAGDGTTTFNIPSIGGQFVRVLDDSGAHDPGRAIGTFQGDMIHTFTATYAIPTSTTSEGGGSGGPKIQPSSQNFPAALSGATFGPETRPINVAFPYFIKAS